MESDKKKTILEVGKRLFTDYGYRDVNIERISKEAGLSTGSFYNYFPGKESFYAEILDTIEKHGIQEAERIVSRLRSPLNRLKALYRFTTLGIKRSKILRGILTNDEKYIFPGSEERHNRAESLRTHIEKMIGDIIKDGAKKRVFRSGLFKNPKLMVIAIYDTILMHYENENIEELMDDILLLIERGLKRRLRLRHRDERIDRRIGRIDRNRSSDRRISGL